MRSYGRKPRELATTKRDGLAMEIQYVCLDPTQFHIRRQEEISLLHFLILSPRKHGITKYQPVINNLESLPVSLHISVKEKYPNSMRYLSSER